MSFLWVFFSMKINRLRIKYFTFQFILQIIWNISLNNYTTEVSTPNDKTFDTWSSFTRLDSVNFIKNNVIWQGLSNTQISKFPNYLLTFLPAINSVFFCLVLIHIWMLRYLMVYYAVFTLYILLSFLCIIRKMFQWFKINKKTWYDCNSLL